MQKDEFFKAFDKFNIFKEGIDNAKNQPKHKKTKLHHYSPGQMT